MVLERSILSPGPRSRDGVRTVRTAGGKRFSVDMLKELQRVLERAAETIPKTDLYDAVFVGFIAHLSEARCPPSPRRHAPP